MTTRLPGKKMDEGTLRGHLDDDGLLDLRDLDLDDDALDGWDSFQSLAQVVRLDLLGNNLTDAALDRLATCRSLSNLTELDLQWNDLGEHAGAVLAAAPHWRGLRALFLGQNPLGDAGIEALSASPLLSTVVSLDLDISDNALGYEALEDTDIELLLRSSRLAALRKIVLLPPRIGGPAAEVDVADWRRRLVRA